MKDRSEGFLSQSSIDQDSEQFDYVRELHDYLWQFVRCELPAANGSLRDHVDSALQNAKRRARLQNEAMTKEQAQIWYLKGFEDAETTERQPVSLDQTMRDAETHFHFVWDANEALRESAAPAELTKEQWGLFCDIFHQEHDAWSWSEPAHRDIPAATFEAVVRMVERYMALRERPAPQPAIDDLPVEDVAIIEMWLESLRMSPSVQSITIRLSDGETLYTIKNERA